jgi:hypothetical protein
MGFADAQPILQIVDVESCDWVRALSQNESNNTKPSNTAGPTLWVALPPGRPREQNEIRIKLLKFQDFVFKKQETTGRIRRIGNHFSSLAV